MFTKKIFILLHLCPVWLFAQGPFDGFLKGKGVLDLAPSFSSNTANTYYSEQGTQNLSYKGNLISLFAEYGLTTHLDLIANASYVFTPTQNGLQDGGLFAKYRFAHINFASSNRLQILAGSGLFFPLSDYKPTVNGALGNKAIALPLRLLLHLETRPGLFITLAGGYNWRFDKVSAEDIAAITTLRPGYQAISPAPYANYLIKIGFPAKHYYLDAWLEWQHTSGGADYEPGVPELPQLFGVSYRQVGGTAYYSENVKTGFYLSSAYIFGGRNVSQVFRLTLGMVRKFGLK